MQQLTAHKSTILSKLKTLERKFTLAYKSSRDPARLVEIRKHLVILNETAHKLEQDSLTWKDLETIGITRNQILTYTTDEVDDSPSEFNDFTLLSEIPIKHIISDDSDFVDAEFINTLYSILDYVNSNYQTIFTQKILISASKTNYLREHFYNQYQDISHIFQSYTHFLSISSTSTTHEQIIKKEYIQLIKAVYSFFTSIQNYIDIITKDNIFSDEDFLQVITSTDKNISIYGLPLSIALDECNIFISEALQYLNLKNKDLFDAFQLDKDS